MRNDTTKYYQLKTQFGVGQTDHMGQRANFREYLDGFLTLYDTFLQDLELRNKCFEMVENINRLFDETNEKRPESEGWVTFAPGDYVTWECLLDSARVMSPININNVMSVCIETGATGYFVARVEEIPEYLRRSAGHHQSVWIKNPRTGHEFSDPYPGSFFRKLHSGENLPAILSESLTQQ